MAGLVEEIVTVVVDGYALSGWQEIDIRRSMQNAAIAFTLKATHAAWSEPAKRLRKAENIEIYTSPASGTRQPGGGDLLCTGAIDSYEVDLGEGDKKTITLHGRSHARDAIDCPPVNHATGRVENKNLLAIAQDLGSEFDLEWATDIDLDPIEKVQRRPGESLFATIERQASIEGAMLLGRPDGSILITKAGTKRHAGILVEGQPPVDRVSLKLVPAMEPSEVVVRGQRSSGTGKDNLRQEERVKIGGKKRHRPHEDLVEGDRYRAKLRSRGDWRRLRSFQGNAVSPRVSRWRDDGGLLWEPGRLMAIQIPDEEIDSDFLLSEVTFRQGEGEDGGTRAELVFVDPQDYGGKAPKTGKSNVGGAEYFEGEDG
jgi:prophage tail gpP-like protein